MSYAHSPGPSDGLPAFGADITNCDREPIHIPGSVQPHGALLAVSPLDFRIIHAGGNTLRIFGAEPIELLDYNLAEWIAPDRLSRLRTLLDVEGPLMRPVHAFTIISKQDLETIDTFVYRSGGCVVLELEPVGESSPEDALALVQTMLVRVQEAATPHAFCRMLAEEVRRVSGFDRVMVYRFLPDGSGRVDAEARGEDVESFLGLHYPASDIPRQARNLYLTNWIRLIPDARYTPAPILPADDPRDGSPLDLSHSLIRSVSPMHLEYLANMGVAASMSLSIIMGGRLWGLIACHHRTPRFLSHRLRMACELFAQMASAKLETKVGAEEFEAQLKSKRIHEELVTRMSGEPDLAAGLTRYRPNLLDYIIAEGVGLWLDNRFTVLGQTPKAEQVAALVAWLNETAADGVFHTDKLPLLYPPAVEFADVASGLIALSVSKTPRDYVLWFRPEAVRTVTWAGDPSKPVETVDGGQRISPRKSFSAWRRVGAVAFSSLAKRRCGGRKNASPIPDGGDPSAHRSSRTGARGSQAQARSSECGTRPPPSSVAIRGGRAEGRGKTPRACGNGAVAGITLNGGRSGSRTPTHRQGTPRQPRTNANASATRP